MSKESIESEAIEKTLLYYDSRTSGLIAQRQLLYTITNSIIKNELKEEHIEELNKVKLALEQHQESYIIYLENQKAQIKNNAIEINNFQELINSEEVRRTLFKENGDQINKEYRELLATEKEVNQMRSLVDKFSEDTKEVFTISEIKDIFKDDTDIVNIDRYLSDYIENSRTLRKVQTDLDNDIEMGEEKEESYTFNKRIYQNSVKEIDDMIDIAKNSAKDMEQSSTFHKERWTRNVAKLEAIEKCLREFDDNNVQLG